jgi:hypothetical protein
MPPDALPESTTVTTGRSSEPAARRALSYVPESFAETCTLTIRSYCPRSSYAEEKSAGVGCDVRGWAACERMRA